MLVGYLVYPSPPKMEEIRSSETTRRCHFSEDSSWIPGFVTETLTLAVVAGRSTFRTQGLEINGD
jgi:hypothetical protein